jgi:hypothetical protein
VQESGKGVFVVELVECFVDDVGPVGCAYSTLCGVEIGLDFRGGVEEYGFGCDSAKRRGDAKWSDLAVVFEFGSQCGGQDGSVDVLWHVSSGNSEGYGGQGVVVLWKVVEWFPMFIS